MYLLPDDLGSSYADVVLHRLSTTNVFLPRVTKLDPLTLVSLRHLGMVPYLQLFVDKIFFNEEGSIILIVFI